LKNKNGNEKTKIYPGFLHLEKLSTMQTTIYTFAALCLMLSCQVQESNDELKAVPRSIAPQALNICDYDQDEAALVSAGWTKTFEDQFSTDLSKWNTWTGGAFNNELQHYQASNISLSGGVLNIQAKRENVTGQTTPFDPTLKNFQFSSGRLECKTNVSASNANPKIRMSARIKWPNSYGLWPAFWSYGDPWPTQGEIDILEARGQEPFKYQTNYFYGRRANTNLVRNAEGFINSSVNLTTCWHVYEVVWSKISLQFYLDGQLVHTNTSGYVGNLFGKTERITLNLAVGGLFFSNLIPANIQDGTMQVDWVRVYRSN
jgi:beta-glucanase (GH16 family)